MNANCPAFLPLIITKLQILHICNNNTESNMLCDLSCNTDSCYCYCNKDNIKCINLSLFYNQLLCLILFGAFISCIFTIIYNEYIKYNQYNKKL